MIAVQIVVRVWRLSFTVCIAWFIYSRRSVSLLFLRWCFWNTMSTFKYSITSEVSSFIVAWSKEFKRFNLRNLENVMMCVPAPPGLWPCVGELALWCPAFARRPWSWFSVSPTPAGPRRAASPDCHTDCETAPSQPAESAQTTHTHTHTPTHTHTWGKRMERQWLSLLFYTAFQKEKAKLNKTLIMLEALCWPGEKPHLCFFWRLMNLKPGTM